MCYSRAFGAVESTGHLAIKLIIFIQISFFFSTNLCWISYIHSIFILHEGELLRVQDVKMCVYSVEWWYKFWSFHILRLCVYTLAGVQILQADYSTLANIFHFLDHIIFRCAKAKKKSFISRNRKATNARQKSMSQQNIYTHYALSSFIDSINNIEEYKDKVFHRKNKFNGIYNFQIWKEKIY